MAEIEKNNQIPQNKLPPQNIEAEKSLLGCLIIDKNAIVKIADHLEPRDFYKKDHQQIYSAIRELFERGEEIDLLAVSNRLKEKGILEEIGGNAYLTELANSVPNALHVLNYAKIVQRKRILRDLIEASYEIAQLGYNESEEIDILLDKAEKRIFSIAQKSLTQRFISLKEELEEAFERIDRISKQRGALRGVPTGFRDLDNLLSGLQKSDLIIVASRPSIGKSSFALNIAAHVAVNYKMPVGIFSLEMSKDQIVDRLIASQANVDLWRLRTGFLSSEGEENDFTKIQRALGVLSEAPIFIDDAATSNVLQMRAMARRLQAEHGLALLIIDYLQLIEPRNQKVSMVQQMTEVSRALKSLARELNVPVLALSQLSRAVEQRTPPIPRLSDLRESGCLTGDTLIIRADTGKRVPIKELVGQKNIPVFSLGEDYKLHRGKIVKVFPTGKKLVYELKTRSKRRIKASGNHPFLTIQGWKRLDQLKIGERIAVPRKLLPQTFKNELSDEELILHAHLLGEGCILPSQPFHYTTQEIIRPQKEEIGISWREFSKKIECSYCGTSLFKNGISRTRMLKIFEQIGGLEIFKLATSDIFWDEIISITPLKIEEVFDATVEFFHNFVADDIIVHNSIEQDADVVLFIYREDKYKPDTIRKNIADIIVAKHRNGPVGKIELYFDDSRATFRNLEKSEPEEEIISG